MGGWPSFLGALFLLRIGLPSQVAARVSVGRGERVCRAVRAWLAGRHPGAPLALALTSSLAPLTGLERVSDLVVPAITATLLRAAPRSPPGKLVLC